MPKTPLIADDLILFARIVEAGSFTKAAEHTGLPKATLSRRLSQLEERFGERLLLRTTRRLALTAFGEQMHGYAQSLLVEADDAADFALQQQDEPKGTLRVSLPPDFHEYALSEVVKQYSEQCPKVQLELDLSPRRVDLISEGFDVAVRAAPALPDDSQLVARRITTLRGGLYASPQYLTRSPVLKAPADLQHHTGLRLMTSQAELEPWLLQRGNEEYLAQPQLKTQSNSLRLLQQLAVDGQGVVALSGRFAANAVTRGHLVRVLPEWHLPSTVVWCVTAGRRLLPKRTTAFIDVLRAVWAE